MGGCGAVHGDVSGRCVAGLNGAASLMDWWRLEDWRGARSEWTPVGSGTGLWW